MRLTASLSDKPLTAVSSILVIRVVGLEAGRGRRASLQSVTPTLTKPSSWLISMPTPTKRPEVPLAEYP